MKNYQKNPIYPSVPFPCMLEQLNGSVQDKSCKWHLNFHIWSLNLNLGFKPTPFNILLVALGQITSYCHVIIMHHNCCIALIVFLFLCRYLSPLDRHGSDDEFDDTDEELYYLQKCQASKNPLFILIQSHSLAPALFTALGQQRFICYMLRQLNPLSSA